MLIADAFCYLDNVQFKKNEWQNRNRIKTAQGPQWLTVPTTYRFPQKIHEVGINNNTDWRRKHLQALITNYSKAPYFKNTISHFEQVLSRDWRSISDLNIRIIEKIRELLGIDTIVTAISSRIESSDDPTDRLVDICLSLGGDTYLSGRDGAKYMDLERFEKRGVRVIFQDFNHPVYPQLYGDFESNLSVVDLLFNCGPESLDKIMEFNPT